MPADQNRQKEVIEKFYKALNTYDVPAALALFDPQILRVEFEGTPMAGTCQGLQEMKAHIEKGRSTWAEGGCNPENFTFAGDKVVVHVRVRVRLKDKTDWIDAHVADAFAFKNDKVIEMRSFLKREQALAWTGIA